jgi:cbb3-type cytochrome oxidase cytochrome c subunit
MRLGAYTCHRPVEPYNDRPHGLQSKRKGPEIPRAGAPRTSSEYSLRRLQVPVRWLGEASQVKAPNGEVEGPDYHAA